eukprot:TRINITY_DN70526_c0_g1_i1.p1 TRINITY_DN70526_c0_g1~~TRINITY_DN70526_c0_g1_i1.p1  ORF type:complete len:849 (+),score=358.35 TRINITY_DN70526_c0_g1_i1:111-2657(+)
MPAADTSPTEDAKMLERGQGREPYGSPGTGKKESNPYQRRKDLRQRLRQQAEDLKIDEFRSVRKLDEDDKHEHVDDDDGCNGGAERNLWGSHDADGDSYEEIDGFEKHWNKLRNIFPKCLRMQEDEDQITDKYSDLLGPRTHGALPWDMAAFGLGRHRPQQGERNKSTESYRVDEMNELLLPQWEYRKPGSQMVGFVKDDRKEAEEGDHIGHFEPLATVSELARKGGDHWKKSEGIGQGQFKRMEERKCEPFLYPHIHYQDAYDWKTFMRGRFLAEPRLLADTTYDKPLQPGEDNEVYMDPKDLPAEDQGEEIPDQEHANDTMKGRVATVKYLKKNHHSFAAHWDQRNEKPYKLPFLDGIPALDRTADKYELATWSWLKRRIFQERKEIARRMLVLFVNILVQMACAVSLWGVGFTELNGGRLDVVLVSFVTGCMGLISGTIGLVGVVSENEELLRACWVCQLWMLSVLISFLYTNAKYANGTEFLCNANDLTASGQGAQVQAVLQSINVPQNFDLDCKKQTARINAAIGLSVVELILGFISVYEITAVLDGINDRSALDDNMEFFKYLQFYLNELLRRCQIKTSARHRTMEKNPDSMHVDSLLGPVRGKFTDANFHEKETGILSRLYDFFCKDETFTPPVKTGYYTKEDFYRCYGDGLDDKTSAEWKLAVRQAAFLWNADAAADFKDLTEGQFLWLEKGDKAGVASVTRRGPSTVHVQWHEAPPSNPVPVAEELAKITQFTKDTFEEVQAFAIFVSGSRVKFLKRVEREDSAGQMHVVEQDTEAVIDCDASKLTQDQVRRGMVAKVKPELQGDQGVYSILVQWGEVEAQTGDSRARWAGKRDVKDAE